MADNKVSLNIEFDPEFTDCVLNLVEAQQSHIDLCVEKLPEEVLKSDSLMSSASNIKEKVAELNSCKSVMEHK